jgi:kynureninase
MITRDKLAALDSVDPLAGFRDRFELREGTLHFGGNSLGPPPVATAARLAEVIHEQWGKDLNRSWLIHDWVQMPARIGDKIGQLVGAAPGQVLVTDSLSINLHRLLAAAIAMRPDRRVILTDSGNFPGDVYMAQNLSRSLGGRHEVRRVEETAVEASIDESVAVVMLTDVNFRTGRRHDMAAITAKAHSAGALALWDVAHSAGAIPVALDAASADFAVGCGYKYLCGGPGAPAFLYIAHRHQAAARSPLSGWMGHASPAAFELDYQPADGLRRHLCSTPAILGLAALEVGVDLLVEAGIARVGAKSAVQCDAFAALIEQECPGTFTFVSPGDPGQRGGKVCISHPEGDAISQELLARGVVHDLRPPDVLRFSIAALCLRYVDLWDAVQHLKAIITNRAVTRGSRPEAAHA